MCNCGSGGASVGTVSMPSGPRANAQAQTNSNVDCPYDIETITDWLTKVECFRDKGLYYLIPTIQRKKINGYIGVLKSAFNYSNNICYFQDQLAEIKSFITVVISTGQC